MQQAYQRKYNQIFTKHNTVAMKVSGGVFLQNSHTFNNENQISFRKDLNKIIYKNVIDFLRNEQHHRHLSEIKERLAQFKFEIKKIEDTIDYELYRSDSYGLSFDDLFDILRDEVDQISTSIENMLGKETNKFAITEADNRSGNGKSGCRKKKESHKKIL